MILISHRGNLNGKIEDKENNPDYINEAIKLGFDVEIDIRLVGGILYLGHDNPQYPIEFEWIESRSDRLWIHCKNKESVEYFIENEDRCKDVNWFWHESDMVTLTSWGYVWAYPGKQPIKKSISVMPEIFGDDVRDCLGVCSDYIENYKK